MATRISPPQNKTYYINPAYLTFVENSGYGANLIQVSASSSCYISVYDPANGIGYSDADRNYQRWKVTAYNNRFPDNDAFYIYVRLERNGTSALVVYSKTLYNTDGSSEDGAVATSDTYCYIRIGSVSSTDGTSIREITYDTGYLTSDEAINDKTDLNEMWELDKHSTPWLIRAKQWLQSFTVKGFITLVGGLIFKKGDTEKPVTDIKRSVDSDEEVPVSDENLPTSKYVENRLESLDERFLRKDKDDRSVGFIASDKGFEVGDFEQGELGSGGVFKMDEDGSSYLEVDKALFRKIAYFVEIMIKKLSHVGGTLILTPASMKCSKVEELETCYRCYFENKHEGQEIYQEFQKGDQARSQTFKVGEGVSQKVSSQYYWRLVENTGENFIDLSKEDCDSGSGTPQVGDEIVLCGNRDNPERQNALILSSYGEGTPSLVMYKGIKSYSLTEAKTTTRLSPEENELTGIVNIEAGSTGASNLEDFPETVFKAVHVGASNLLRNSGFTGNYQAEDVSQNYSLNEDAELFSAALKYWEGEATVSDESDAVSGKRADLGSLSQTVELIQGERYVVSFKAKGSDIKISCGSFEHQQSLKEEAEKVEVKFVSDGNGKFTVSGNASVYNLQLERGTIATDWKPSPYDNDKTLAEFQALKYLQDAIVEGDTTILGGLILSSIIKLGNYKDGVMQKVNAGMSGIYNDDDDVAFWGGGTFEQAIRTVMRFKENPQYKPTAEEWNDLAKFVVTHGGDLILKGDVFADNGYFRGRIEAKEGFFHGDVYANSGIFKNVKSPNGSFTIDEEGNVKIIGTFETSVAGKRIIIDADSQSIVLYDELGRETAKMNFYDDVGESWTYGAVQLKRYQQDSSNVAMESFISASQVDIIDYITKCETHYRASTMQTISLDGKNASMSISLGKRYESPTPNAEYSWLTILQSNCWPTSSQDVGVGGIYSDNGTLKIRQQ